MVSVLGAANVSWSWRKLAYLFSIFPLYFVASDVIINYKKIVKIIEYLLLSGLGMAIIGIGQFLLQFAVGINNLYNFWAGYIVVPFLGNSFSEAVLLNPSWLVNISGQTYFRAIALFPDPHMFSFYLGLLLPLALGMYLINPSDGEWRIVRWRWLWAVVFLALLIADILTFSRVRSFSQVKTRDKAL